MSECKGLAHRQLHYHLLLVVLVRTDRGFRRKAAGQEAHLKHQVIKSGLVLRKADTWFCRQITVKTNTRIV